MNFDLHSCWRPALVPKTPGSHSLETLENMFAALQEDSDNHDRARCPNRKGSCQTQLSILPAPFLALPDGRFGVWHETAISFWQEKAYTTSSRDQVPRAWKTGLINVLLSHVAMRLAQPGTLSSELATEISKAMAAILPGSTCLTCLRKSENCCLTAPSQPTGYLGPSFPMLSAGVWRGRQGQAHGAPWPTGFPDQSRDAPQPRYPFLLSNLHQQWSWWMPDTVKPNMWSSPVIGQRLRPPWTGVIEEARVADSGRTGAIHYCILLSKWSTSQCWCVEDKDPTSCPLPLLLTFLQLLVDRHLAFYTIKTYASAISSCHKGLERDLFLRTRWLNAS